MTAAVDAIGTRQFPVLFVQLCAHLVDADSAHLSAFFEDAAPVEIVSTRDDHEAAKLLSLYLEVGFVLDPFYQLFVKERYDRVDRLADIAPDDFKRSEYYSRFFKPLALKEECGLMIAFDGGAALFLSVGAHSPRKLRLDGLRSLLPVLSSLAHRHWRVLTPERSDGTGRLAAQLEAAFMSFGNSKLSPKESQVARMILQGHSSKSMARVLDNSPETIKVHRKRLYAKLDISSQTELLSLFLGALRMMPAGASGDPLIYMPDAAHIPRQGD